MIELVARVKEQVIREGIASVHASYEPADPRLAGSVEGFEIAAALTTQAEFEKVLRARLSREQRMRNGFHPEIHERIRRDAVLAGIETDALNKPLIDTDDAGYWHHRHATMQIEFVYERLLLLWGTAGEG